ncbi:MAG: hypothetical protein QME68_00185 [Elusimicrobiota bacterium]|nr:hypothetical protein [Elusimicrobiota bacterium]
MNTKFTLDKRTENDIVFSKLRSKYIFGCDVGTIYRFGGKFNLGLSAKNITQPDIGLYSEEKIPIETTLGGLYKISGKNTSTFLLDVSYRNVEYNIKLGFEQSLHSEQIFLRTGINLYNFTTGVEFTLPTISWSFDIRISYTFLYPFYMSQTIGTHHAGFKILF